MFRPTWHRPRYISVLAQSDHSEDVASNAGESNAMKKCVTASPEDGYQANHIATANAIIHGDIGGLCLSDRVPDELIFHATQHASVAILPHWSQYDTKQSCNATGNILFT